MPAMICRVKSMLTDEIAEARSRIDDHLEAALKLARKRSKSSRRATSMPWRENQSYSRTLVPMMVSFVSYSMPSSRNAI